MYHGFGSFVISVLFVISAIAVVLDMRKFSDSVWKRADEPKNLWFVVGTVAAWPVGMAVYLLVVRPKLEKLAHGDSRESLREELFAEWRAEQERGATSGATVAGEHPVVSSAEPTEKIS